MQSFNTGLFQRGYKGQEFEQDAARPSRLRRNFECLFYQHHFLFEYSYSKMTIVIALTRNSAHGNHVF